MFEIGIDNWVFLHHQLGLYVKCSKSASTIGFLVRMNVDFLYRQLAFLFDSRWFVRQMFESVMTTWYLVPMDVGFFDRQLGFSVRFKVSCPSNVWNRSSSVGFLVQMNVRLIFINNQVFPFNSKWVVCQMFEIGHRLLDFSFNECGFLLSTTMIFRSIQSELSVKC